MIEKDVFLVQADTTVGFLSKDHEKLSHIKGRSNTKKTLEVVSDLKTLSKYTRVPNSFKNKVRRAKRTTFIYPNGKAFRVVDKNSCHNILLKRYGKFYSTSANYTGKSFEYNFAFENCDISIENKDGFNETIPSKIYKINNLSIRRIR